MFNKIGKCGLDCSKCEAYLATINNDDNLREKVAKNWSELNNVLITKEMINCMGCNNDLVKTPFCESMCNVRICANKDNYLTCKECNNKFKCEKLKPFIETNKVAHDNISLKLIKLTHDYKDKLIEMIEEWKKDQIENNTDRSPFMIFKNDCHDFDNYLNNLERKTEIDGRVPNSVFFLLDEEKDRLLGACDIRHYLNDLNSITGGHIGDGIRPSERRKGYATKMIELALDECKKLGIKKVLMTCDKVNIGSAKSIINNGGILENEVINDEGVLEQRYWINLE